jgi:hypothetical protein
VATDDERTLEQGLRFLHMMGAESRHAERLLAVDVVALTELLIAKGVIDAEELDGRKQLARMERAKREAGQTRRSLPMLGTTEDKYALTPADIPCAENLPLCGAACCRLVFDLTLQDLEEGVVKWEYGLPYRIRQTDHHCVHFVSGSGCNVYEHRPAACRVFDCRKDQRIWLDYENRIPNPDVASLNR